MTEASTTNGSQDIPPKLDLRKQIGRRPAAEEAGSEASGAPPAPQPQGDEQPSSAAKKQTTRIPLEAASAAPAEGAPKPGAPATIRIKPTVDLKRKTSRIPLESAIGPADEAAAEGEAGKPKTIRLKRPSEAATIKVGQPAPREAEAPVGETPGPTKTARLDEVAAPQEESTQTRRKTIVVKRPAPRPAVRGAAFARPATGEAAAVLPAQTFEAQPVGLLPVLLTVAAVVVVGVVIYLFSSQAFGRNISLTQLSYWPTGPDLSWPGRLSAVR